MAGLEDELEFLDRVHAAQAWMLDHARMRVTTGEQVAGDRYTAETLGRMLKSYVKELAEEPDGAPYFGRLGFEDTPAAGDHRNQRYHIGRRRIAGEHGPPLVIDWRAPVSSLFYQAGVGDRRGVSVRRRYGWTSRPPIRLTGFEDERLDHGEELGTTSRLLAEEIERPRVGPMRDIVATIQPEQDELVRADLDQSLCVQGGPGTGKTAVGLHRAAYLLYAHRRQLKRTGVLVVGPNPAFLDYISAVLPALGEVDVRQCTLEDLLASTPVRGTDTDEAALVKHDARMAEVVRRALAGLIGQPAEGIVLPDGSYRLRVAVSALARELALVRSEDLPYGVGRERFRTRIVALLQRQLEYHGESPNRKWLDRTGRSRPVTGVLDRCWPRVRPEELLATLLGDASALKAAADGILTGTEQAALLWARPPRSFKSAKWSAADLVLLDEIAGAIQHPEGFGHIVVDEAQDLSPMQCRALARRSRHGSLTVLGDLAQGTSAWAAAEWGAQLTHLGKPDAPVTALTLGFRVPAVVLSYANRLLPRLKVAVPAARSVRADGELNVRAVPDLGVAVLGHVRAALDQEGSIAVIATAGRIAALPGIDDPDGRVTLLPATLAKGLEFDHVVVVEPAEIVAAEPRGLHRLYVVLTRAVSRLDVLHTGDSASDVRIVPEPPLS
ncbi:HelD family protein [Actinoplanes regularis]|uniref:DNA helicase IV n=1 Tax=Actinoplanes regularis TaxID=52697 RepID=A0A238YA16_9ACTN|nr:AAA family ATPase [Actinoplanes regularis]GIE86091.1 DNA helicase [Actinoplanes regularis]SNR67463.1 DNA helicase IV [Actinoplanes regularis]